ncbi:MAG: serine hydroxymethyltransferase [Devosia sp.]|nr:serine hydroxymethyltransferase [Devosia sp.]
MATGFLFEFVQMGQVMRVAAIDEVTGTEVVVITPLNATRLQMQRVAAAKLRRKLEGQDDNGEPPPAKPSGRYA